MNNLEYRLRIYTVRDRSKVSASLRRLYVRLKSSQIAKKEDQKMILLLIIGLSLFGLGLIIVASDKYDHLK